MNFLSRLFGGRGADAATPLPTDCTVIDVRSPGEFAGGHLQGAINIPLERIGHDIARHVPDNDTPLVLCCRSGMRSGQALAVLQAQGYRNVTNGGPVGRLALRLQRRLERG